MRNVFVLAAVTCAAGTYDKRVIHTPWWPPIPAAAVESVGIVSGELIFMTAMMAADVGVTLEAAVSAV